MKLRFAFLAIVAAAWAGPALADMTAHYVSSDDMRMMTIEIATGGDLRVTFGDHTHYFLTKAGHDYLVETSAAGPTVTRPHRSHRHVVEHALAQRRNGLFSG